MIDSYTDIPVLPEKGSSRIPTSDSNRSNFSGQSFDSGSMPSGKVVGVRSGDLSDYGIDSLGIFESFTSTSFIPAKIINISNNFITAECVVDSEIMKVETRKIEKDLIPNELQEKGKVICIKISKRPGKFVTEFIDGANLNLDKYFSDNDDLFFSFNSGSLVK